MAKSFAIRVLISSAVMSLVACGGPQGVKIDGQGNGAKTGGQKTSSAAVTAMGKLFDQLKRAEQDHIGPQKIVQAMDAAVVALGTRVSGEAALIKLDINNITIEHDLDSQKVELVASSSKGLGDRWLTATGVVTAELKKLASIASKLPKTNTNSTENRTANEKTKASAQNKELWGVCISVRSDCQAVLLFIAEHNTFLPIYYRKVEGDKVEKGEKFAVNQELLQKIKVEMGYDDGKKKTVITEAQKIMHTYLITGLRGPSRAQFRVLGPGGAIDVSSDRIATEASDVTICLGEAMSPDCKAPSN